MEEIGRVIEVAGDTARVGIKRKAACETCEAKSCCLALTKEEMLVEAKNEVSAREGEMVKISLESKVAVAAGVIVYIFPLLFFLLGFGAGMLIAAALGLGGAESIGVVTAFAFLILSYLIINQVYGEGKKRTKRFEPVVKEIIKAS